MIGNISIIVDFRRLYERYIRDQRTLRRLQCRRTHTAHLNESTRKRLLRELERERRYEIHQKICAYRKQEKEREIARIPSLIFSCESNDSFSTWLIERFETSDDLVDLRRRITPQSKYWNDS